MSDRRRITMFGKVAIVAAILAFLGTSGVGAQQSDPPDSYDPPDAGEVGVYFLAWICPTFVENPNPDNCQAISGVSLRVEINGVEIEGSPFITQQTSLLPGFFVNLPDDATITVTEIGEPPAGYEPAPGFDPLVVNIADLPQVGCGGEAKCPGVEFINVLSIQSDGLADELVRQLVGVLLDILRSISNG